MKKFIKDKIRLLLEMYDSPEAKSSLKVTPAELKKMTAMDFDHSFEKGKYMGKNSADLNTNIDHATYKDTREKYGILDTLYKEAINIVPEFKTFKNNKRIFDQEKKFELAREIILDVDGLDDDYSIKINLYVEYYFKGDELMERPEGTIKVLFSPSITTTRTSIGLNDPKLGGIKGEPCKDNNCSTQYDISDDEANRVLKKLDKLLYGTPDKEDKNYAKLLQVSDELSSIEDYNKLLIEIRKNLLIFSKLVYGKYGIKIF